MASLGLKRKFEAVHGTRERRTDIFTIEVVIQGAISRGFVGGIDYVVPLQKLSKIADDLEGEYLDDIVGRATNENIAQFLFFQMSEFPIEKVRVTEDSDRYVEIVSDEFDKETYPALLALNKGHSLLLREKPESASHLFTEAIELDNNYASAYVFRGRCTKYLSNYQDALSDFQRSIEIDPDFGEGWRNLGNAYLYLGVYDDMIRAFDRAVELMSESALAINNRGYGYYVIGKHDLALVDHEKAVELDPRYAEAHYDVAMALIGLGERERALDSLSESRRLKRTGEDTFHEVMMY